MRLAFPTREEPSSSNLRRMTIDRWRPALRLHGLEIDDPPDQTRLRCSEKMYGGCGGCCRLAAAVHFRVGVRLGSNQADTFAVCQSRRRVVAAPQLVSRNTPSPSESNPPPISPSHDVAILKRSGFRSVNKPDQRTSSSAPQAPHRARLAGHASPRFGQRYRSALCR